MREIDVLIPVLNEAKNIPSLVNRILKSLGKLNIEYKIFFIDDFSTDETKSLVESFPKKYNINYLLKDSQIGKSFSLLQGVMQSKAKYIVMIDGDLQCPPEAIYKMYQIAKKKNLGVVVGNRVKDKRNPGIKFASKLSRFVIGKIILGSNFDIQSGLKIFKRNIANTIKFEDLTPWTFDIKLIEQAKRQKQKIGTLDIVVSKRKNGISKNKLLLVSFEVFKAAILSKIILRNTSKESTPF